MRPIIGLSGYIGMLGIFSRAAEFVSFHGICIFSQNFVEFSTVQWYRGQIWRILVEFRWPYSIYIHDFAMKYVTAIRALTGGILKFENIELSLSEILTEFIWWTECIFRAQLPATNTAYLVALRGHRTLVRPTMCGKFAVVRRGIWQVQGP